MSADVSPRGGQTRESPAGVGHYRESTSIAGQRRRGRLEMALGYESAPLSHYHYDLFEVDARARALYLGGIVSFVTGMHGEINRIAAPIEPALPPIIFSRTK